MMGSDNSGILFFIYNLTETYLVICQQGSSEDLPSHNFPQPFDQVQTAMSSRFYHFTNLTLFLCVQDSFRIQDAVYAISYFYVLQNNSDSAFISQSHMNFQMCHVMQ